MWTNWTDEQWSEWENRQVSISMLELEDLVTALELIAKGKRPNREDRKQWDRKLTHYEGMLAREKSAFEEQLNQRAQSARQQAQQGGPQ